MPDLVFIGGDMDGRVMNVPDGMVSFNVPLSSGDFMTYVAMKFAAGVEIITVMVLKGMTPVEVFRLLLGRYRVREVV